MRYLFVSVLVFVSIGGIVYLLAARKSPQPPDDWQRLWDARLAALQSVLGPSDDRILASITPFYLGGSADVLTFRQHTEGVCYVTAGIIGDGRGKPNELGEYELMICLREPAEWAPNMISNLARYTTETALNPGDTMDMAPALPQPTRLDHLLFVPYAKIVVEGKEAAVMLCLGITGLEYDCARKHGSDVIIDWLKQVNVYPFTDLARESVSCDQ
jgi:hypothetical protein